MWADQHQGAAHLEGEEDEEDAEGEEDEEDAEYEEGSQPAQSRGESEARLHEDNSRRRFWVQGGRGPVRPDLATACSLLFESWLSGLHATVLYIYSTVS